MLEIKQKIIGGKFSKKKLPKISRKSDERIFTSDFFFTHETVTIFYISIQSDFSYK